MSDAHSSLIREETILGAIVLLMAGIAPNIFPAAQAGFAKMSELALWLLLPSLLIMALVLFIAVVRGQTRLVNRIVAGAVAGVLATAGLEVVRLTGFHFGWMPGDLAMLLGVLLTDRFMEGPSTFSTVLGYTYHFWNGAAFGIIFAVVMGRTEPIWAIIYSLLIATGFLMSPAVRAAGAGFMGLELPMMPVTVYTAHLVFGVVLGVLCRKWVRDTGWLLAPDSLVTGLDHPRACAPASCVGDCRTTLP